MPAKERRLVAERALPVAEGETTPGGRRREILRESSFVRVTGVNGFKRKALCAFNQGGTADYVFRP